jgi:predicted phosphodiesterase
LAFASLFFHFCATITLMKVLVISDIHANLTALETVLADAGDMDAVWCLGDLVGYGPDPNECIERVRELSDFSCLLGNHDAATLGRINIFNFNPEARASIRWTQETITPEGLDYLSKLPETLQHDEVTLVHGSPRQPVWEYILDTRTATINFKYFDTSYCFTGHTHLPVMYYLTNNHLLAELITPEPDEEIELSPRAILNPGSVGQPRDHDARASYALYDPELGLWTYQRVPYDISAVQERMRAADLPLRHIQRLEIGW